MCIMHSTLWDATTPYTARWQQAKSFHPALIQTQGHGF